LADLLLGWALAAAGSPPGTSAPLEPLDDHEELALRAERLESVVGNGTGGRRGLLDRLTGRT
jgi:hypothetical protein